VHSIFLLRKGPIQRESARLITVFDQATIRLTAIKRSVTMGSSHGRHSVPNRLPGTTNRIFQPREGILNMYLQRHTTRHLNMPLPRITLRHYFRITLSRPHHRIPTKVTTLSRFPVMIPTSAIRSLSKTSNRIATFHVLDAKVLPRLHHTPTIILMPNQPPIARLPLTNII
jgi:hypothetical protein